MQRLPPRLSAAAFNAAATHATALPRRPRLHIIVILADTPLLRHAHTVLLSATRKGLHVFLQAQVNTAHAAHLISLTHLPQLLASSRADYVALIAERDLTTASLRLRLSPTADFIKLPVSQFTDAILSAWAAYCQRSLDPPARIALAMNPNVVTSAHLDALLQRHSNMRAIRRVYATLARLVNTTQQWLPESPPPKPLVAPTSDPDMHPCVPDHLISRALKSGLSSVRRHRRPTSPKSDISYFWLRRSNTLPARVLRSQLIARTLHSSLLNTFSKVSTHSVQGDIPAEAQRQRLLREINDLLPRVEKLSSHLSKRPRRRSHRARFFACNPWENYIRKVQAPEAVAGVSGNANSIMRNGGWRCCVCSSFNKQGVQECQPCGARCCVVNAQLIEARDAYGAKTQDAIAASAGASKPWIFSPMIMQAHHLHSMPNGAASPEVGMPMTGRSVEQTAFASHAVRGSPPVGSSTARQESVDLNRKFGAISVDDNYAVGIEAKRRNGVAQSAPKVSAAGLGLLRPAEAPKRLASSAPSGHSYLSGGGAGAGSTVGNNDSRDHASSFSNNTFVDSFPKSSAVQRSTPYGVEGGAAALPAKLFPIESIHDVPVDGMRRKGIGKGDMLGGATESSKESQNASLYEANNGRPVYDGLRRGEVASNPIAVPDAQTKHEGVQKEVTFVEALAAASDAANGGTGSATEESMRTVSAILTAGRDETGMNNKDTPSGMYNMF